MPEFSIAVLSKLERKQRRNFIWFLSAVGSFILALALTAAGSAWYARLQWQESQHQLNRANPALAAGIFADLDVKVDASLTERHRQALWKLADLHLARLPRLRIAADCFPIFFAACRRLCVDDGGASIAGFICSGLISFAAALLRPPASLNRRSAAAF